MLNKFEDFLNESAIPNLNIEDCEFEDGSDSYVCKLKDLKSRYSLMFKDNYAIPQFHLYDGKDKYEVMILKFKNKKKYRYISDNGTIVDILK